MKSTSKKKQTNIYTTKFQYFFKSFLRFDFDIFFAVFFFIFFVYFVNNFAFDRTLILADSVCVSLSGDCLQCMSIVERSLKDFQLKCDVGNKLRENVEKNYKSTGEFWNLMYSRRRVEVQK